MMDVRRTLLIGVLLLALARTSFASPVQGEAGSVEGVVRRAGSTEALSSIRVTLSSGPTDPTSLRALSTAGQTIGFYIPATATPTGPAPVAGAAPVTPPAPISEERILQSVLDSATSQGMSPGNASLTIALNNFRDQTAKYRAMTDSSGRFAIMNIPPGQYTVRAERDGFFGTHGTTMTVTVTPNQTAVAVLSMVQGATVGGNIRDEDGEPVANATVQIFQVIYPGGFPTLGAAVTAKTNFRGDYRLFWMPAGEYFVGASREVYATQGARVFYPGTPELTSAAPITLKSGEDKERIDFVLTSARMVKITGQVTSTAPPPPPPTLPPGVQLTPAIQSALASAQRNVAYLGLVSRNANLPDPTDNPQVAMVILKENRGEFEFTAPAGAFDFAGMVMNGGFGKTSLDIRDTDLYGVALTIQSPLIVKGSIVANGAAPDFTKMRVYTQADNRLDAELGSIFSSAGSAVRPVVNADGSFTLAGAVGSRMHPFLQSMPAGAYVADVGQDGNSVYDSGFEVTADTHPIQILMNMDGGIVKGSVLDVNGKPLTNAIVVLVPPEARRLNRTMYRTTTSDNLGRFTISNVPPGDYKLFTWPSGVPNGSFYSATYLARYEDRGRPVTVGPSATITVDGIVVPFD